MILLSDTFLANSSEPWHLPDPAELPEIDPDFAREPNANGSFMPYLRDEKLARPWAVPGTPGLRHRIGGLEEDVTGNISYQPENHDHMTRLRAERVARIEVPVLTVEDPDGDASLLIRVGPALLRSRPGAGDEHGPALQLLRAEFLIDVESYTKVDGLPIFTRDVMEAVRERVA